MSTSLPHVATTCVVWIIAAAGLGPAEPLPTDTPAVTQTLSDNFDNGSLEPGKSADLVAWLHDLYAMPPADAKELAVEMTIINGEILYDAEKR